MINDVSRAYFYAKCSRNLYVELPVEYAEAHPDFIGKLRLCLYCTRDAALNWQETLSEHLVGQRCEEWDTPRCSINQRGT